MNRNSGQDGFDEFATAAWPRLLRSAYLLTGDHHLAEDLTQTALVRTYAHWRRVRRADALAYSRRVLVNLNIDRIRRRHGTVEVGEQPLATVSARPDTRVDERDEAVRLLRTLTARERQVVVLRHYFDLSEAEVAHELGVAKGTVKSTLARALAKLRVTAENGAPDYEEVVGQ
ncbi:MAG TPA: SigE family RNA polymerase sigma factor [Nocardioides sp.]|uniref:SigE family RNA polymerase sigma factor n=1 Tax=uncultured Nocardioides sp. TaxID=198441 RepID=UPI000ECF05F3|nr:SigE family RNA polymerase sigma factor [uncultured Nocardioides sp.]HCB05993.1 SigE family RNA polymerase sigma factor [Nocardioides sp.]HRD64258.1 SigE family RNA polymerase sigma factor [Nocardioides sp.]HRI98300.1 SigE family RNA polymerase sigma factor [Nocardioides sp.]HRK48075.1 SigE family RNA polymerase sigma factor [Nocardioides sp.]